MVSLNSNWYFFPFGVFKPDKPSFLEKLIVKPDLVLVKSYKKRQIRSLKKIVYVNRLEICSEASVNIFSITNGRGLSFEFEKLTFSSLLKRLN